MMRLSDVVFAGAGLSRPECVVVAPDGGVFAADARGGVAALASDGSHRLIAGRTTELAEALMPNGVAFDRDGSFLVAHLGAREGGVFRLTPDGQLSPVLREADGVKLPPTNHALRDAAGRLWATVSTRAALRHDDWRPGAAGGFLVLQDGRGARIVADGLGYANECGVSPDGCFLYVNETFARRLSRFPLGAGGALGAKQVVAEFGVGEFPDGLAFDAEGQVWVTAIVADRLLRVEPESGRVARMLDAGDSTHVAQVECAFRGGTLSPADLSVAGSPLANVSSLAFAGPGRREAWLGCLLADRIARTPMPVAGAPPPHWLR
jgi:sugar lactone lactonase YvrE